MSTFNWKIVGAAGEGIKVAGLIFSKTCFDQGFFIHGYTEYPSLIRGGHNTFQVAFSLEEQSAPQIKLDLLVDLDGSAIKLHQSEITDKTIILTNTQPTNNNILNLPLDELIKQASGVPQMKNIIALGASCFFFNLDLEILNQEIVKAFSKKGQEVISKNQQVAKLGYDFVKKNYSDKIITQEKPQSPQKDSLFLTGNQALSLGAIAGGMKIYLAYPMTPATSILHFMAKHQKTANITVRHAEDEIGVINMALGSSFAGARSMVATSGGGFSLMNEGLGLSGVSETPLVIVNVMRPGPASGMPTWSGQGDLLFVINASQDEFPRIVLTPGDPQEAFQLSKLAQNLAEKYQLPVIILSDKYLAESYFTVKKFTAQHTNQRYGLVDKSSLTQDKPFPRYQNTDSGVSPRTLPGQANGVHLCNSYDHDQLGYATEEIDQRNKQVEKRNKKISFILKDADFPQPQLFGSPTAKHTLVSWGSNKGVILQALKQLPDVNFIHFPCVWPFPLEKFNQLTKSAKNLITLECNSTSQLSLLIRQQTSINITNHLLKYDGRPFYPSEIVNYFKSKTT